MAVSILNDPINLWNIKTSCSYIGREQTTTCRLHEMRKRHCIETKPSGSSSEIDSISRQVGKAAVQRTISLLGRNLAMQRVQRIVLKLLETFQGLPKEVDRRTREEEDDDLAVAMLEHEGDQL